MNKAYDEIYLEDAMDNLGTSFEYAKNVYNLEMDDFLDMFINAGIASKFEKGVPKYVTGMSGIELVFEVVTKHNNYIYTKDYLYYDYTCEYWCGWILAYMQWYYGIRFKDLHYYLKMEDLERLYPTLHEVSQTKALEIIGKNIKNKKLISRLKDIRLKNEISQKQLSDKSGVSLRMIQQYEQKKKDINKASASSLLSLANVLSCNIEDIMEWEFTI